MKGPRGDRDLSTTTERGQRPNDEGEGRRRNYGATGRDGEIAAEKSRPTICRRAEDSLSSHVRRLRRSRGAIQGVFLVPAEPEMFKTGSHPGSEAPFSGVRAKRIRGRWR